MGDKTNLPALLVVKFSLPSLDKTLIYLKGKAADGANAMLEFLQFSQQAKSLVRLDSWDRHRISELILV
jgi:hypothetical protein